MEPGKSIEKDKIRRYYYIGSISATLTIIILVSLIYSRSLSQEYQKKIVQLSSGIIAEKKRFLKNAVDRTIGTIEFTLKQVQQDTISKDLSQEQIKQLSIERVSRQIKTLTLIDNGYIWVNKVMDYGGGDRYAIRLIHPNLPHTEGEWLSTDTEDIRGNKPYKLELDGIKAWGETYFDYYFKKPGSEKIAHKLSYAKLYKPWDWVIATGVYLDDVDQLVKAETVKMEASLKTQEAYAFGFVIALFVLAMMILIRFEKQISAIIGAYEKDIKEYTADLIAEKNKTELALAEVKQLRGLIPICSKCKKIRDDQGYWNNLEVFIESRSDASFSHGVCPECSDKMYGNEAWYKRMKERKQKE